MNVFELTGQGIFLYTALKRENVIVIPQVVNISRQKYAVGLFWQPVASGADTRDVASDVAKSLGKKYNLYTSYRSMAGLGATTIGHRNGMRAAAPEIVEGLSEYTSFVAAFYVIGKYWVVSVRNGIILGDELFDTDAAARAEYNRLTEIPDWGALFAPTAWNIPRAIDRDILEVMGNRANATLRPISRTGTNIIAILLCLLALGAAGYLFRDTIANMFRPQSNVPNIDPKLAAEYKRKIEEQQNEKLRAEPIAVIQPLVMPYDVLPDMTARADLCYRAAAFLMQPIPGWIQTNVECGTTHAFATFRRDFGTLDGFYEVATDLMPGAYVVPVSDSELNLRVKLPGLDTYSSLEEKDPDTIMRQVSTAFQKMDARVDVDTIIDVIGTGPNAVSINVIEVGAESKLAPQEFIKIFAEFSGVYMTKVSWDARSKTWNYEVIIYGK